MANTYRLVSADSHVVEPPDIFEQRLPVGLRDHAPKLVMGDRGDEWTVADEEPIPLPRQAATGSAFSDRLGDRPMRFADVMPALYDAAERVRAQEADSIDAEIIYPSSALWDALGRVEDTELHLECIRVYNDWIAAFCAHAPGRLVGVGKIPSGDTDAAVSELQRCVDMGLRGVVLDAWPSGSARASDPADEPFWAAASAARIPVSVHWALGATTDTTPSSGIIPGRTPPMAGVIAPMIAGRVFDRHPDLRLVLAHGDAGWLIHWLEVGDINYVRMRHLGRYTLEDPEAVPSDYFRRHCWFTFSQDRSSVKNRHKIGLAHLMWASHFPLDVSEYPDDRQRAMRVTNEIPMDERDLLLAGNVARLYKLPGHERDFDESELGEFVPLVHF